MTDQKSDDGATGIKPRRPKTKKAEAAPARFEAMLWAAADALRNNMDAAEYKHVVLGLIFLKYISDAFEERHEYLKRAVDDPEDEYHLAPSIPNRSDSIAKLLEDPDEYRAKSIFWVPPEARWAHLKAQARQPTIGQLVDDAMAGIERDNPALKGVLPKEYARPGLDKQRLGQLIDLISNIRLGDREAKAQDVLGQVYEYFLSQFASAEGKKGGEFYTPRSVVKLLVEMIEPYHGRVYDPCCGSSGMFVQSIEFIRAHASGNGNGGKARRDISIWGQESNYTTWRLAKMNLAIRDIDSSQVKWNNEGSFLNDAHKDLKADFIIANPPFNVSDWSGELLRGDGRWQYGAPPAGNANFAWLQHFAYHLNPQGKAGVVLAKGALTSKSSGEGEIRKALIADGNLIDCIVNLPAKLFLNTQIPAALWFMNRARNNGHPRKGEILFIDARNLGHLINRRTKELAHDDIQQIAATYHAWHTGEGAYEDVKGFCASVPLARVQELEYVLTPGRYVGLPDEEDDFNFAERFAALKAEFEAQLQEEAKLNKAIAENLAKVKV